MRGNASRCHRPGPGGRLATLILLCEAMSESAALTLSTQVCTLAAMPSASVLSLTVPARPVSACARVASPSSRTNTSANVFVFDVTS